LVWESRMAAQPSWWGETVAKEKRPEVTLL
jgi:hypothetical protein